jgi:uncharacterized protein (DUF697 family)/tellurite resistance protein
MTTIDSTLRGFNMTSTQQQAILTLALLAAFADGNNDDSERERIRQLADSLSDGGTEPDLPRLYQNVLLKRANMQSAVAALADAGHRQLAYEMAVCVCDADGRQTDAERGFLAELRGALGLSGEQTAEVEREAAAMADLVAVAATATVATAIGATNGPVIAAVPDVAEAELDRSILNHAILTGALELLPQSWASLAIIPLQIKMVYGIGKAHGYQLDQGHIRELLATVGVGLTSQYLEQFGRKLLGGLLGRPGRAVAGIAVSFATTYALGQLAKRYYAGGRQMSPELLKNTFQGLLDPAKRLQAEYLPQIQQKSASLDVGQVMAMVRGA